jgi:hypothetical protein
MNITSIADLKTLANVRFLIKMLNSTGLPIPQNIVDTLISLNITTIADLIQLNNISLLVNLFNISSIPVLG